MGRARLISFALVLTLLLPSIAGCIGATGSQTIRVGSKDFPEQFLIAEMYALLLEEAGFKVERKLNLGATPVAHEALKRDQIDLYPEYTGTALLTVLKLPTNHDRQEVYDIVSREYLRQFDLVWLDPAPMNNTQALATTQDNAARYQLHTISDFVARSSQLRLIGPPEFAEREDGLPGIERIYGKVNLRQYLPVAIGLKYKGLIEGQAEVAVAFGTDGEIDALDLVVLEDDKQLFPPYQIAPVVRRDVLDGNPRVRESLNKLAPLLTDDTVRRLNFEISQNAVDPQLVARQFLVDQRLIASG